MAIRIALNHTTRYAFDRPVGLSPHVVRLRPSPHCRTPILSYAFRAQPETHFLNWQQDLYGNHLARLVFPSPARELKITIDLEADLSVINPFAFFLDPSAETYPFVYEPLVAKGLAPYLETEPPGPRTLALVESLRRGGVHATGLVVEVNQRLNSEVRYLVRMESGVQSCEETLSKASGSCRDSAWALVQVFRHLGLAARFVSGYLIQLNADVESLIGSSGPSGSTVDASELHAWTEVYLPGGGWVGLDPTSGLLAAEGHIPLACAADPVSAAPVSGSFAFTPDPSRGPDDHCAHEFSYSTAVTRVQDDPMAATTDPRAGWPVTETLDSSPSQRHS